MVDGCQEYQNSDDYKKDSNGKKFYKHIYEELRNSGKTRIEIVDVVVDYLIKNDSPELKQLISFLKKKFGEI